MREAPLLNLRILPEGVTLKAFAGLHYIQGNSAPYFTLTFEELVRGRLESCGAGHEAILREWPQYADIAALHLSDIHGVPMHAEANGWYALAGALPENAGQKYHAGNSPCHFPKAVIDPAKPWDTTDYRTPTPDECLHRFAEHVRIPYQNARSVRDAVIEESLLDVGERYDWAAGRAWYAGWIEAQKPRWQAEADACIARHNLSVFGDAWQAAQAVAQCRPLE